MAKMYWMAAMLHVEATDGEEDSFYQPFLRIECIYRYHEDSF